MDWQAVATVVAQYVAYNLVEVIIAALAVLLTAWTRSRIRQEWARDTLTALILEAEQRGLYRWDGPTKKAYVKERARQIGISMAEPALDRIIEVLKARIDYALDKYVAKAEVG